jgi:hypothetical protein
MSELSMKSLLVAAVLIVAAATISVAQGPLPEEEAVLIPIVVPPDEEVPGAFGSRWTGEVWLRNGSSRTVGLQRNYGCTTCAYPPGAVASVPLQTWQSAALVYMPRSAVDDISINARLFELSRRSQPQGVEVPVVREGDFLATAVHLLAIPLSEDSRVSVRVFDPFPRAEGSFFDIEVLAVDGGALATTTLWTRHEHLGQPGGTGFGLPSPGFAIIPDLRLAFPTLDSEERVHVRITPHPRDSYPPMRYWTMASVTDNETQHVLLITPQCCATAVDSQ